MELLSALTITTEVIGLVEALAKLIESGKAEHPNSSLSEVLHRLQIEAVSLSRDLENRLRTLSDRMHELHLNPHRSLDQNLTNLEWYDFVSRHRLKTFREECWGIHRQLTSFLDDATAMLICMDDKKGAAEAFKACFDSKRKLDEMVTDPDTKLRDLVDGMLATAREVSFKLQIA